MSGSKRSPGARRLAAALAVVALACVPAAAALARDGAERSERLSGTVATTQALRDPDVRRLLAREGYTRYRTLPLDDRLQRVSFFNGSRIVLEVAVAPDGRVEHSIEYRPGYVRSGSAIFQRPAVLMLLPCLLFVLLTARVPLRNPANLDVVALAGFAAVLVLQNERLLEASVYVGYPLVAYLTARLLWKALRPSNAVEERPTMALFDAITSGWELAVRRRTLALGAAGAAIGLALVSIPGGFVVDVGFASIAGATDLLQGRAPYGNLPAEIVHGDTYPLFAYALYVPAAALAPVHDGFSNLDGALWISALAALLAAAAIWFAVARIDGERRSTAGPRLAIAWLVFPPTLVGASSGSNDLVVAACLAGALALATRPGRSMLLLAVAGWVKVVPFVLVPLWLARLRSGGLARSLAVVAGVSAGVACWLLLLGGSQAIADMVQGISFQAERGSLISLWTLLGIDGLQLVVQCAIFGLVAFAAIRASRDELLASDLSRVAALAAAILLGFQLAANYWTPVYLTWVFPLIAIALLAGSRERTGIAAS